MIGHPVPAFHIDASRPYPRSLLDPHRWSRTQLPKLPLDLYRSFRGVQYTALSFGERLEEVGIVPSMGRIGSALDNAMAESFVSTLKAELVARATAFPPEKRLRWRSSSTWKGSTTAAGNTRRWATRAPSITKQLKWRRLRWRSIECPPT